MYGRRGAICAYFHWTWEYLNKGIAWAIVERMLADQERYEDEEVTTTDGGSFGSDVTVELTEENADDFIRYINSIG